ncbi:hypothetical protein, partial [Escherichia coli]
MITTQIDKRGETLWQS